MTIPAPPPAGTSGRRRRPGSRSLVVVIALAACIAGARAETIRLAPEDDWFSVLAGNGLRPGDEVELADGTYTDPRRLEMRHRGTKEAPIAIRAAEGARAVIRRPDARQNSIDLAGCRHLALQGLEITGGAAGIRIRRDEDAMPEHLVFEDLHLHHVGGVAITANEPGTVYKHLVFRRNHIHHTGGHGEAFYLGCNNTEDGSIPGYVCRSVIEGNHLHDLRGPTVSQGDAIELKDGCFGNLVRDNVIHDTNYPGIIVYGTAGNEPNIIERNVIWTTGDHGIQAAADAVVRNNIIIDPAGDGIHCRDHQGARVGNLQLVHNTIVISGDLRGAAIRVQEPANGKWTGPVVVANNALHAATVLRLPAEGPITLAGNAGSGNVHGRPGVAPAEWTGGADPATDFLPPGPAGRSVFPAPGSRLIGAGSHSHAVDDDFNGTPRKATTDAGAYRFDPKGNPGWRIGAGLKAPSALEHPRDAPFERDR